MSAYLIARGGFGQELNMTLGSSVNLDEGRLILKDIWLGEPQREETEPQCGHRLVKAF